MTTLHSSGSPLWSRYSLGVGLAVIVVVVVDVIVNKTLQWRNVHDHCDYSVVDNITVSR